MENEGLCSSRFGYFNTQIKLFKTVLPGFSSASVGCFLLSIFRLHFLILSRTDCSFSAEYFKTGVCFLILCLLDDSFQNGL